MQKGDYLFTSESVSAGHPDKICDKISDEILDFLISQDPESRVAVETMATTNRVIVAGEVSSKAPYKDNEIKDLIKKVVHELGYEQDGFHWDHLDIETYIHAQSPEIAAGVGQKIDENLGAGDQGIMFGYACKETEESANYHYMPLPIYFCHKILRSLAKERKANPSLGLAPDAKTQITLEYKDDVPVRAKSIVVSHQHHPDLSHQQLVDIILPHLEQILPDGWMCDEDELYVNPSGRFVIGGPDGDAGLTGRKIIVDTYGGSSPHGGGAFSGKDATKVDRSAAYAARYLAKNIVAAGLAEKCTVQLSYAIGVSHPLSLYINLHNTGIVHGSLLANKILKNIDLSPYAIIKRFGLLKPIFSQTACYGHFGRTPKENGCFSWEKTDLVDYLRSLF